MERFEYDIKVYSSDAFSNVAYFCSEQGQCASGEISTEQQMLANVLNGRGSEGWELIQLFFAKDGIMTFWKRRHVE